ncbi:hypothetical protein KUCAC02_027971 [Chaenocephalus aceratus]|uniref:Uncharacterized protein n=1 Tax=Chaenocephalus aceratus TaxID=36190 RepID=A0ACB9X2C6_CHAAC|nr:hypothetical protein KUCAC02_027971 [Chaenocephalus aceratus]
MRSLILLLLLLLLSILSPGWSKSHLKLWNCIPFSSPIDSGAVSKTNGGFRKSILMKEKERGKESFCPKLQAVSAFLSLWHSVQTFPALSWTGALCRYEEVECVFVEIAEGKQ